MSKTLEYHCKNGVEYIIDGNKAILPIISGDGHGFWLPEELSSRYDNLSTLEEQVRFLTDMAIRYNSNAKRVNLRERFEQLKAAQEE